MQDEGRGAVRFRYATTMTFKGMCGITRIEPIKPVPPQKQRMDTFFKSGPECDFPV
jgi:hypothetical protein